MLHLTPRITRIVLLVIAFTSSACWSFAAGPATDSGVFTIFSGQKKIGTEKFRIAPVATGFEASAEIEVDVPGSPKVSEICLLRLDDKLRPTAYERQQKLPKKGSVLAAFGPTETKLSIRTDASPDDRIFLLPSDRLVVLDTNFFHHYSVLIRQYDAEHGGAQHFNIFIPQEATPGTISLEFQGKENQMVGKTARELNHYQALTEEVKMDIWATPDGAIYRISIPQANLDILRQ